MLLRSGRGFPVLPWCSASLSRGIYHSSASGALSAGFLGTDLPSLSSGELVGKFSAAPWGRVTCELVFTVIFPFSFSPPPPSSSPSLPFPLGFCSRCGGGGGGGGGAAEVAGSKAVPALPAGGQAEAEPPEVEGGAKATGNEPLLGARQASAGCGAQRASWARALEPCPWPDRAGLCHPLSERRASSWCCHEWAGSLA